MGSVRTRKFGFAALVSACVLLTGCSALTQRLRNLDVSGCGDIKWGMTLEQVQMLLGPKTKIETEPKSGRRLAYIRMTIGGVERDGFVSTDAGDRVRGVDFIFNDPSTKNAFNVLKRKFCDTYAGPSA